jgi:uncharacterized protein (TIGR02646 family)
MMPVERRAEPSSFEEKVRTPGRRFLETTDKSPESKGFWSGKEYWREALADLRRLHGGVCAYSGLLIYPGTGASSVDHFKPKSRHPHLAYEWSNFRLACQRVNACKSNKENILDPFEIQPDWFTLDFDTFRVEPHSALEGDVREAVLITIAELKLNEDGSNSFIGERQEYIEAYAQGDVEFSHLEKRSPFIAYELKRQGLTETIRDEVARRVRRGR